MKYNKWMTYIVPSEWNQRTVTEVLKGPLLLSNRMINRLTRSRGIRLNGSMPWLNRVLKTGDRLQVAVRPRERSDQEPEPIPVDVIYEDEDWMVVNKSAGIKVHPTQPAEGGTLTNGILYHWKETHGMEGIVRPVHRLDRHTSGLLLVAKYAYAHQLMDRELREKRIRRIYWAVACGRMGEVGTTGTIDAPIAKEPNHPLRRRVDRGGDHAVTHYRVLDRSKKATLLQLELDTGRTHQIRVHLAHLGHPLAGDKLYGGSTAYIRRQALHAQQLHFTHPLKGEKMIFTSPLPQDLTDLLEKLGLYTAGDGK
ncbi:RluA family pseudouridine synthase [Desmospora activa]|uniref:Pseudouridine synthase n=1 Tax=Desmospora activa DSM 45169 TaxID=1121389 RepID=A0A2T4ZDB7_9BACL|nr:RluA family pseudouridine synthase [Desmospora activa]PTM59883.1 tRNA pseudouridine32 synthase / 23S rRNA pseudouridine746 synthase/23S rRNA pseudouridine1911/1915/1917 synthase [Desmospora activa DSM 45169]